MGNTESRQLDMQPNVYRQIYSDDDNPDLIMETKRNYDIGSPFDFEGCDDNRHVHLHTSIPERGPMYQVAYDSEDITDPNEEKCYSYSMMRYEDLSQNPSVWTEWKKNIGCQWRF